MASITITTTLISTNQTISTYKAENTAQLNTNNAFVNTLQPNNLDYKTVIHSFDNSITEAVDKAVVSTAVGVVDLISKPIDLADTVTSITTGKGIADHINDALKPNSLSVITIDSDSLEEANSKIEQAGLDKNKVEITEINNKFVITAFGNAVIPKGKWPELQVSFKDKSSFFDNFLDSLIVTGLNRNNIVKDYYNGVTNNTNSKVISNTVQQDVENLKKLNAVNNQHYRYFESKYSKGGNGEYNDNSVTGSLCRANGGVDCSSYGTGSSIDIPVIKNN